jgi:hypothetical protein
MKGNEREAGRQEGLSLKSGDKVKIAVQWPMKYGAILWSKRKR